MDSEPTTEWHPAKFFRETGGLESQEDRREAPERSYLLLILNQPLNTCAYQSIAVDASKIICVDGGANHLREIYREDSPPFDRLPDVIVGDLDSLDDEVRDFYTDRGKTQIIGYSDDFCTDFMKALRWVKEDIGKQDKLREEVEGKVGGAATDIVVFGRLAGRIDQGFSVFHHLLRASTEPDLLPPTSDMYLLSEQNISFVISEGRSHRIYNASDQDIFGQNIGLIPIAGPIKLSTKGLEWDVTDWETRIGGKEISTSNHIRSDIVEVTSTGPVLITIELADSFCPKQGEK